MKKSIFLLLLMLLGNHTIMARECVYSHEEIFTIYQEDEYSKWRPPHLSEKTAKECPLLKEKKPIKGLKRSHKFQHQTEKDYNIYCVAKGSADRSPQKIGALNFFQDDLFVVENKHYISEEDIARTVESYPDQEQFIKDQIVFVVEGNKTDLLINRCHTLSFKEGEVMVAKKGNNKFYPVVIHESQYIFVRIVL